MEEQKEPGREQEDSGSQKVSEIQETSEEEYAFLQEVIKDEAGSANRLRRDILRITGFGLIFGIVACISFCALRPWMEKQFRDEPEEITIPQDEQAKEEEMSEGEEGGEPETQEPAEERAAPDAESYRQMLQSLKEVARETGKSVVEITGTEGSEDWTEELNDSGHTVSGIVAADNGQELLILGNVCPVKNAENIHVTFSGGDSYKAVEKSRDSNLGLAVYAVPRAEITEDTWTKIDKAVLGNSNLVNMGDTVIVYGKPFGYANMYTYGIISSDKMYKNFSDGQYEVLYTDIAGAIGGSGVIVNIRGEVIGIVDQTLPEEESRNLIAGYSISGVKEIIQLLLNGESVPYTGIYGSDVTEDMQEQGLPTGIYVKKVETDSPAMAAGIQNGDVITAVDDVQVAGLADYNALLMKKEHGGTVMLKGYRQGTGGEYVDIDFIVTVGAKE